MLEKPIIYGNGKKLAKAFMGYDILGLENKSKLKEKKEEVKMGITHGGKTLYKPNFPL